MKPLIDYFLLVVNELIEILDSLSFNGSYSLLYYLFGAVIIGFIIKLIKGGSNEFEHSFNFSTGSIVTSAASKYSGSHQSRKQQIVKQRAFTDGFTSGLLSTTPGQNRNEAVRYIQKYY